MRYSLGSLLLLPFLLTGCNLSSMAPPSNVEPVIQNGAVIRGMVHGGQQPIVGSHLYLFATGTGGYGGNGIPSATANASQSLLSASDLATNGGTLNVTYGVDASTHAYVITDSNGNFTITNDYSCSAGQQLYLYAIGGYSDGNPSDANSASGMMAGLGDCSTINSSTYILLDEISTVATAYALAGFATDALHISSSGTTLASHGIYNAMLTVGNLESLPSGQALATTPAANGANGTPPQEEVNSLANILAACVNTTGPSSSTCATLLNTATSNGIPVGNAGAGTVATDTATAAIYIAQNPGQNVSTLYGIPTPSAPFNPVLGDAPNDWTISIVYTGGGLTTIPGWVAIDGSGNVWATSTSGSTSALSEFTTVGKALSGASGYTASTGSNGNLNGVSQIAIDTSGNAWVTNQGPNANNTGTTLGVFTPSGAQATTTNSSLSQNAPVTGGGLKGPVAIAIDASGNVWVGNHGSNSISEFNSTGTALSGSNGITGTTGAVNLPSQIAIDTSGNLWIADSGNNGISEYIPASGFTGPTGAGSEYTDNGCVKFGQPQGLVIAGSGYIWVSTQFGGCIADFNPTPKTWLSGTAGYSGGGLSNGTIYLALDSAGNAWVSGGENYIAAVNSSGTALSPSNGYINSGYTSANAVAVDGSGNVWTIGCTPATSCTKGALVEYVGVAKPVVTPIVANLVSPYATYGSAINKP